MPPKIVYLDCAATTPIDPRVLDEIRIYLEIEFGNSGSRTHVYGERARSAVESARAELADLAGAARSEVVFTSGATESNNLAILGLAEHGLRTGKTHLVSTQIEHSAVLEPLQALTRRGFSLTLVPPTEGGRVEPSIVRAAVREETLLVSVMQINNETGIRQPIEEIAQELANHPAYFHVDAAQGFGKEIAPLRSRRIDLISISGHKIYAPKGVGALVARRRNGERPPLLPLAFGGGQELGLRPGTLPVPLIAGLGRAAALAQAESDLRSARCAQFRARLLEALRPLGPTVFGDQAHAAPHIVNLSFPGIDGAEAVDALRHIAAISNGAACTSRSYTCSHVLQAMRVPADRAAGALRFSWYHDTPEPDWGELVASLDRVR